ncbi:MAG: tetratricopeptide repeat protein [Planctomycetota bacterium]
MTPLSALPRLLAALLVAATLALIVGCQTSTMLREDGYAAINDGDWFAAQDAFQRATRKNPADGIAHYYLGLSHLRLGDPLAAQLSLERALALREDDADLRPRILDRLADALYQQQEYEKLTHFLGQTAAESGDTADYLRHANYLVATGDHDAAQLAFRKAAFFAPEGDTTALLAIADFYASIGDVPNQRRALQYAYWTDPQTPGIDDRLRQVGIVPGPTAAAEPPRPELMR